MGYLSTWSGHATFRKRHPEREDPLIGFKQKLLEAFGTEDDKLNLTLIWPIFLILGRAR